MQYFMQVQQFEYELAQFVFKKKKTKTEVEFRNTRRLIIGRGHIKFKRLISNSLLK